MLAYSIDKKLRSELGDKIGVVIEAQVKSPEVEEVISELVNKHSRQAVSDVTDDELRAIIQEQINETKSLSNESLIARLAIPKGGVLPFNRQSCPEGWIEYAPAYGRFIRGIDRSGTGIDPAGLRQPGSMQEDAVKRHNHSANMEIGAEPTSGAAQAQEAAGAHGRIGTNYKSQGLIDFSGDSESRPKNVALLYCEKQ